MDRPQNESDIDSIKNDSVDREDKSLPGFENESANRPKSTEWPLKTDEARSEAAQERTSAETDTSGVRKDIDEAFKAATHGTDDAPHGHPTFIGDPRESTGRKADDSWKQKKRTEEP